MNITQALVLAGGKGERLRPLTNDTPKPLVKVGGRPIIEYSLELLASHGVKQVILATGYLHHRMEEYCGNGEKFGLEIVYSEEKEPLGTGGALKQAEGMLDENFFMLNGDNIADFDLSSMRRRHSSSRALATIALVEVEDVESYGVARVEGGKITEFIEKPARENVPTKLVNAGAYVISKSGLGHIPRGFSLIERTLFPALASKGKLHAFLHNGIWLTTDTLDRIAKAEEALARAWPHKA